MNKRPIANADHLSTQIVHPAESTHKCLGKAHVVSTHPEEFSPRPRFKSGDYRILRSGIKKLNRRERAVITHVYWESMSLTDVAEALGIEWHEAKAALASAQTKLKELCLSCREFSGASGPTDFTAA